MVKTVFYAATALAPYVNDVRIYFTKPTFFEYKEYTSPKGYILMNRLVLHALVGHSLPVHGTPEILECNIETIARFVA